MLDKSISLYERIGGAQKVQQLVKAFYPRVQAHPLLKPLFPEGDEIEPVMENQYLFLTQYLGGPPLYTEKKGHPMLRARHLPFSITPARAQAWLDCMHHALDEVNITGTEREAIWSRLMMTAYHMVNQPEDAAE